MNSKSLVVVAAHIDDFIWRCSGAMALHAENGWKVTVVCIANGVRHDPDSLWKGENATFESVTAVRRAEAAEAAAVLGAEPVFLNYDDCPLPQTQEISHRIAAIYRAARPQVVLTHAARDPGNRDHADAQRFALEARMIAMAAGHGRDIISNPQFFAFEPHESEACGFAPDTLLDISPVWEKKISAMHCMVTQRSAWSYYLGLSEHRGRQAGVAQAEAYQQLFPRTVTRLM